MKKIIKQWTGQELREEGSIMKKDGFDLKDYKELLQFIKEIDPNQKVFFPSCLVIQEVILKTLEK